MVCNPIMACFSRLKNLPLDIRLGLPYTLETRPSSEFSYDGGISKLANLPLDSNAEGQMMLRTPNDIETYNEHDVGDRIGRQGNLLKLSTKVDLESRLTIGCAGAVLAHLQRKRAVHYLPADEDAHSVFRVSASAMFSLNGFL